MASARKWRTYIRVDSDRLMLYMLRRHTDPSRLSERADVSVKTIYRALNGARVRIETLAKIAAALDVPPGLLVGGERNG